MTETSDYHLQFIKNEYQELFEEKGNKLKALLGDSVLQECIANWDAHTKILETKEIQTFLFKAIKP